MSKIMYPQEFFSEQWQVYQKILDYDYMGHQGIYQSLSIILESSFKAPITFLEIGCGDARFTTKALSNLDISSYHGIDISPVALELAGKNLKSLGCPTVLVEADFNPLAEQLTRDQYNSFDCILIAFALHHLTYAQKDHFIGEVFNFLHPQGKFILIDIVRRDNEDRQDFLRRYFNDMKRDWVEFTSDDYLIVESHVSSSDFPETKEDLIAMGYKNNFKKVEYLYQDESKTMATLSFSRNI